MRHIIHKFVTLLREGRSKCKQTAILLLIIHSSSSLLSDSGRDEVAVRLIVIIAN